MAPTKRDQPSTLSTTPSSATEKEPKLTPEQSASLVLTYLRKQNRPYSATDISANLKNRVSKAAAAKLLKDLHDKGEIEGRSAGKQVVYHALQEEVDDSAAENLQAMETETARLRDATSAMKAEEKVLRAALKGESGAVRVSLPELKASVTALEGEKGEIAARLELLKTGGLKPVSVEEREKVAVEFRRWSKSAAARKRIRREMWEEIAASLDKGKVEEVREELDLEI